MRLFSISVLAFFLLAPFVQNPIKAPIDVYQFKGVMGPAFTMNIQKGLKLLSH